MIRLALGLVLVAVATMPCASAAEPEAFARDLKFEGVGFSLVDTGEMKARALFTTLTICKFAKYNARDDSVQDTGSRLLVLRFARNLSAKQLQQVFRGVVKDQSGYSNAELDAFLRLLPAVKTGSILRLRSNAAGKLEVFGGNALAGSVVAPHLAAAMWAGLGGKA